MSIETLKQALPDWAKDLRLNLGSVLTTPGLTSRQAWGTALAGAIAARNPTVIRAIAAEAAQHLDPTAVAAAKTAAAVMGMNNVYYRFTHLVGEPEYQKMPARLRMQGLATHGVDPLDFELWALAVSAINGCGMCMEAHEREVIKKGATRELVQNVIRIAAVIQAVSTAIGAAEVLEEGQAAQAAA